MLGSNVQKGLVAALALRRLGGAGCRGRPAGTALGARGVEGVARRAAGQWGEKHPRRLEYTTAALQPAKEVVAGEAPRRRSRRPTATRRPAMRAASSMSW